MVDTWLKRKYYLCKIVYKDTIEFRRHDNNASSRMAHTSSNRIDRMYKETSIIKNMLNSNFLTKKQVEFISKQYKVYCKRIDLLSRRSVTGIVKMVSVLNYYSRKRLWLTDLYYVLKWVFGLPEDKKQNTIENCFEGFSSIRSFERKYI